MNTEYYYPHTADRSSRDAWEAAGAQDMRQRARQRAVELLGQHWPSHLPAGVEAAIRAEFDIRLPADVMRPAGGAAQDTGVQP